MEKREISRETASELYMKSQVYLIQFMIKTGLIKDSVEYTERFAEIFHDLAYGKLGITDDLQREIHDKLTK